MPRRTGTREAMLEVAQALLRTEGPHAITTRSVAKAVGISQPSFYAHFGNVQALIQEAAAGIAEELLELTRTAQQALRDAGPSDPEALREHFVGVLERMKERAPVLQLYARHRRSEGPLGDLCRQVDVDVHAVVVEHLLEVIGQREADHASPAHQAADRMAAVLTTRIFTSGELAIEGRVPVAQLAQLLALETLGASQVFLAPLEGSSGV